MKYARSSNQHRVCLHNSFPLQQTIQAGLLCLYVCVHVYERFYSFWLVCTDFYLHKFFEKTMHLSISFIICTSNKEFNMKVKSLKVCWHRVKLLYNFSLPWKIRRRTMGKYIYLFVWCQLEYKAKIQTHLWF